MRFASLTLLSAFTFVLAHALESETGAPTTSYHLFHRIVSPSSPLEAPPFTPRALVSLLPEVHLVPDADPSLSSFQDEEGAPTHPPKDALYQLALIRPGDIHEGHFSMSSVKACHIIDTAVNSDRITLLKSRNGTVYGVEYFLENIPHDGSCPRRTKKSTRSIRSVEEIPLFTGGNTTVLFKQPSLPPLPALRTPPPLSPQGTPVVPPEEKSFLQKYWMYIAIAALGICECSFLIYAFSG